MPTENLHPLVAEAVAGCCGDDRWRGHLCSYHQGYADAVDALERLLADLTPTEAVLLAASYRVDLARGAHGPA